MKVLKKTFGLGVGQRVQIASGVKYEAEALALFSRMTIQPDKNRKKIINKLIKDLIDEGIWSELDALWVIAAHDEQSAKLNWIKDSHNLTSVNSTVFVADYGIRGNGVNSWLNTNYNPSTHGVKYQQNSALFGVALQTVQAGKSHGAYEPSTRVQILANFSNYFYAPINYPSYDAGYAVSINNGFYSAMRTSNTIIKTCQNNKIVELTNKASTANPNITIGLGSLNGLNEYNTDIISIAFVGASLSDVKYLRLLEICDYYLSQLGCSLYRIPSTNIELNQNMIDIDILGGQSNSIAQAGLISLLHPDYRNENSDIIVYNYKNNNYESLIAGINTSGYNYQNTLSAFSSNFGSEIRFLFNKSIITSDKIAFIKNSMGGQPISGWSQPSGVYWIQLKNSIEKSIVYFESKNIMPNFNSMLWVHCESDIMGSTTALQYKASLISLINSIRSLHSSIVNLKFVIAKPSLGFTALNDAKTNEYKTVIDQISIELSNVIIFDVDDLSPTFENSLHYSSATINAIGDKWAELINV
jgi:hypothetical protein